MAAARHPPPPIGPLPEVDPALAWIHRHRLRSSRTGRYLAFKRGFDLAMTIAGAPFWLPVFCLCYCWIKVDDPRAPAIYVQHRTGRHGHRFSMYKFRTMAPDADRLKEQLAHLNELRWPDFKITHDPRVTTPGRFLRRLRLDEVPQFLNVLRGHMSLVGPRPTSMPPKAYDLWHTQRFDVPPGMTCVWQLLQLRFRHFDERMRLDILYVERCCLLLDLQILGRTVTQILTTRDGR